MDKGKKSTGHRQGAVARARAHCPRRAHCLFFLSTHNFIYPFLFLFFPILSPLPIFFSWFVWSGAAVANDRPTSHAIRPNLCAALGQAMTDAALGLPQQRPGAAREDEKVLGMFFFFFIIKKPNEQQKNELKEDGVAAEKISVYLTRSWRRCRRRATTRGRRFGQMRCGPGRVRARQEAATRHRWHGPALAWRAQTRYDTRPRR